MRDCFSLQVSLTESEIGKIGSIKVEGIINPTNADIDLKDGFGGEWESVGLLPLAIMSDDLQAKSSILSKAQRRILNEWHFRCLCVCVCVCVFVCISEHVCVCNHRLMRKSLHSSETV